MLKKGLYYIVSDDNKSANKWMNTEKKKGKQLYVMFTITVL